MGELPLPGLLLQSEFPWERLAANLFGFGVPGGMVRLRFRQQSEMTGWEVDQPHPYEVQWTLMQMETSTPERVNEEGFRHESYTTMKVAVERCERKASEAGWNPLWAIGNAKENP